MEFHKSKFIDKLVDLMKEHAIGDEDVCDEDDLREYALKLAEEHLIWMLGGESYSKAQSMSEKLRQRLDREYEKLFKNSNDPIFNFTPNEWKQIIYWICLGDSHNFSPSDYVVIKSIAEFPSEFLSEGAKSLETNKTRTKEAINNLIHELKELKDSLI